MKTEVICRECNQLFMKENREIRRTKGNHFCSHSCCAIYNNRLKPLQRNFCKRCEIEITPGYKHKGRKCDECKKYKNYKKCGKTREIKLTDFNQSTLGEVSEGKGADRYGSIRKNARLIYRNSDKPKYCCSCGFTAHFEVCHIKPINTFPLETLISEINRIDNLTALCPNCHWELHNGLLKL